MAPAWREKALKMLMEDKLVINTEARTSPSGFPFKVAQIPGSLSDPAVYNARKRICDILCPDRCSVTPKHGAALPVRASAPA